MNKKTYATALAAGAGFAGALAINHDKAGGVITALVGGIFFTLLSVWRFGRQSNKADAKRAQFDGEGLVKDAATVLSDGSHKTQGWLFLTKQRLVFEPLDRGRDNLRIDLPLAEVTPRIATGVFNANKLEIAARGKTHRFVIQEREMWVVTIHHAASQQPATEVAPASANEGVPASANEGVPASANEGAASSAREGASS